MVDTDPVKEPIEEKPVLKPGQPVYGLPVDPKDEYEIYGNPNAFITLTSVANLTTGVTKTVRAMEVQDVGCLVLTTTIVQPRDVKAPIVVDSQTFVPGVKIGKLRNQDGSEGHKLVRIK